MIRNCLLLMLILTLGCSSDSKKPKYEAADNSSADSSKDSKGEKKEVPDWMKGTSNKSSDQKSLSTEGSKNNLAANDTVKKGAGNSPQNTESNQTNAKKELKSNPTTGSGEATALMAKLLESYDKSVKYYQKQQSRQMTQEEFLVSREKYAKMIEEWLEIANKMVGMDLRIKDKLAVISLKKMAHESLMNFNRPEHEQLLYDFGETLKDETNNDVKKIYEYIKLKQPLTKIMRGEPIDEKAFFERFEKFVSYWRDDYEVYQNVENWLNQMYPANRDYYVKAIEIAAKNFTQSLDTQVMARCDSLNDRLLAVKIGFDMAVASVLNEKPNAAKELLDTASRFLAQPKLSLNSVLQIIQAGHQLESAGEYAAAKKYFELVSESTKSYTNPKFKETVKYFLDSATKRFDLLGKPLMVEGMIPAIEKGEFVRKPIDFSSYRGKVVILFFWAAENPMSYQLLNELDKFYVANEDKDLALIGINADRDMAVISKVMSVEIMGRKRKWTHLMPTTPKVLGLNASMAKKCGVDQLPFNLVIDQEGKVDSYSVYGFRLQDTVSRLLGKPVKKIYTKPKKEDSKKENGEKGSAKEPGKVKDAKKDDAKKDDSKKPKASEPQKGVEKGEKAKTEAPESEKAGNKKDAAKKEAAKKDAAKKDAAKDAKSPAK